VTYPTEVVGNVLISLSMTVEPKDR